VAVESTSGLDPSDVDWALREDAQERSALDAWCWAVGPAVWADYSGPVATSAAADSLAIIVWNVKVGGGRVDELVADLRAGVLTGTPVRDFVLLLQEVHRAGDHVPQSIPAWAVAAGRGGDSPARDRSDVLEIARRERLFLFYAPSMRNGRTAKPGRAEDRGNAILSTVPLSDPAALELPYEGQRRVAVQATIEVRDVENRRRALQLTSVHLDNRARLGRVHRSVGRARLTQARALAKYLAGAHAAVLGGDLNTWMPFADAATLRELRDELPVPAQTSGGGTLHLPFIPDLELDHLLFRLPPGWEAGYGVVANTYGSDHHPLAGWLRTRPLPVSARPSG
jgi:endonuclease/exonuclease/phosphatase family metal-dependent hydrolase